MNFKKIELVGFKSFADKLEIKFDEGITGIVGPNGCGKSNVSDAIRWVLGEQSTKLLRSSNMQEVISRGANTLIITNQNLPNSNFNYVINIPETNPLVSPILSVVPLQLLAYYISKNKGLDVDKPRNLAKSVTVE